MKEENKIKVAIVLTVAGIAFIVVGSMKPEYSGTKLGGFILASGGLVLIATKIYERIREKAKAKREKGTDLY